MGAPGVGAVLGPAPVAASGLGAAGSGCRGPERICPGLGAGDPAKTGGLGPGGVAGRPGANTTAGGACGAGVPGVALVAGEGAEGALDGVPKGGWTGRPAMGGRRGATGLYSSAAGPFAAGCSASIGGSGARVAGADGATEAAVSGAASIGEASSSGSTAIADSAPLVWAPPVDISGASYSGTSCP